MPQHKSAKKRAKTSAKREGRNRAEKSKLRGYLRSVREKDAPGRSQPELQSMLDKAVKKGIIHKNKAGRLKSRLSS